jgi:hypothetical protein
MIVRPAHLALLTFASLFALERAAFATEGAPAPPLRLVLGGDGPRLFEAESLRAMLEAELGRSIVMEGEAATAAGGATLTILYRAGDELTVSYHPSAGDPVTRTVSAPATREEVAALAVLLGGNVARDQTTELLDAPAQGPERTAVAAAPPTAEVRTGPPPDVAVSARLFDLGRRAHPLLWSESLSLLNVGAELAGRTFYVQLGASFHPNDGHGRELVGPAAAVGARFPLRNLPLSGESDIAIIYFRGLGSPDVAPPGPYVGPPAGSDVPVYTATRLISRLRIALVYAPRPRLELFAGGALAVTTHFYTVPTKEIGPEVYGGIRL